MKRLINPQRSLQHRSVLWLWLSALLCALPVAIFVLILFYYWFAVADRYFVFLYEHNMGSRYPNTSPFSNVTSSRYWMAGLVAGGAVMVLYGLTNVHFWQRTIPRAVDMVVAGLCVAYLLMPLIHHIAFTDGYYYITGKDNFFSRSSVLLQVVTWLLAGGIAWGTTWLRKYLAALYVRP